jgi:hypothetical protein
LDEHRGGLLQEEDPGDFLNRAARSASARRAQPQESAPRSPSPPPMGRAVCRSDGGGRLWHSSRMDRVIQQALMILQQMA